MVNGEPWRVLWAKTNPYHPLWKHLLDSAAVSLALRNPLASDRWTKEQLAWVVGLHDVGKADGGFQHQITDFTDVLAESGFANTGDAKCRHERLSARFLKCLLIGAGTGERCPDTVQRALVAHHGYWDECGRDVGPPYAVAQNALCEMLQTVLNLEDFALPDPSNHSSAGMRLAGHIVLCDWIASNEEFFDWRVFQDTDDLWEYANLALAMAEHTVERLHLHRTEGLPKPDQIVPQPRPLQQAILGNDIPPGLVIIEAPMGEGKTEAAWMLAEKWRDLGYRGMFMALPTMATSESLHERYKENYLKKLGRGEDTKLVHGMAWLRDAEEPENSPEVGEPGDDRAAAAAWFRPTRRAMLAAHGVGTVDQAMLAGMHVKFGFLRLFGLADRVLVIDEVHAYDAYMSAIICRLLQWCACLKLPVILLSATLSAKQRASMIEAYGATGGDPGPDAPYPLITVAEAGKEARIIEAVAASSRILRLETHVGLLGDAAATAIAAKALVQEGGCCCIILNTVKQAQRVYAELGDDIPKLLFHARFTAADRECITKKVIVRFGKDTSERPEKFILVATQVVEQSLDVDFDHMMTEIAPMDLLLQRSGRLHRHRVRDETPTLHVLTPLAGASDFGSTSYVYSAKPLLRTAALLDARTSASLPEDFRLLIEATYGDAAIPSSTHDLDSMMKADAAWEQEVKEMAHQGRKFCLREPSDRDFRPVNNDPTGDDDDDGNGWRAKTRLGANDRTVILVDRSDAGPLSEGKLNTKQVKAVYRGAVKVARYLPLFSPVEGYGSAIKGKERLAGLLILPLGDDGTWRGTDKNGNVYRIMYDPELGLIAGRES